MKTTATLALPLFAAVISAAFFVACGPAGTPCNTDADCFSGEVCSVEKVCQEVSNNGPNNGSNNGTNGSNNGLNNGSNNGVNNGTNNGSNNGVNNGANNGTTGTNNGTNGVNNGALPACVVDPFTATCSLPDDNDDFADYLGFKGDCGEDNCGLPGCSRNNDVVIPGSGMVTDVAMCANEHTDRYSQNLIPCDNKTFTVQATIRPLQMCDPDLYSFNMSIQGFDCTKRIDEETMMERVRCEELPDGSKRITTIVVPSISIAVANLYVEERAEPNVSFDYEIDFVVRE